MTTRQPWWLFHRILVSGALKRMNNKHDASVTEVVPAQTLGRRNLGGAVLKRGLVQIRASAKVPVTAAHLVQTAIAIAILALIGNNLGLAAVAIWGVTRVAVSWFAMFIRGGLEEVVHRQIALGEAEGAIPHLLAKAATVSLCWAVAAGAGLAAFAHVQTGFMPADLVRGLWYSWVTGVAVSLGALFSAVLRARGQFIAGATLVAAGSLLSLGAVFAAVVGGGGIERVLAFAAVAAWISAAVTLAVALNASAACGHRCNVRYGALARSGMFVLLGWVALSLVQQADRIVTSLVVPLDVLGHYVVASALASPTMTLAAISAGTVATRAMHLFRDRGLEAGIDRVVLEVRRIAVAAPAVIALLLVFGWPVARAIAPEANESVVPVAVSLSLAYIVFALALVLGQGRVLQSGLQAIWMGGWPSLIVGIPAMYFAANKSLLLVPWALVLSNTLALISYWTRVPSLCTGRAPWWGVCALASLIILVVWGQVTQAGTLGLVLGALLASALLLVLDRWSFRKGMPLFGLR